MDRKNLPLLLMLAAGGVTCVITFVEKYTMIGKLVSLFWVLLIFCILGYVLKWTLDRFERQNEEKLKEEGEVIEKEPDSFAEAEAGGGQEESMAQ